jgi:hypothetical protein
MKQYDSVVSRETAKQIYKRIAGITAAAMLGHLTERDYSRECGVINGLKEALEIMEDAEVFVRTGKHIWEIEEEQNKNAISSYEA